MHYPVEAFNVPSRRLECQVELTTFETLYIELDMCIPSRPFAVRHDGHPVAADTVGITPGAQIGAASVMSLLQSRLRSPGMHDGQHCEPPAKVCAPPAAHSGGMEVTEAAHCRGSQERMRQNM